MDKLSVYIETSIVSYLAANPSQHPVTLRNQQLTHAWWNTQRERYALYTADYVLEEAAQGEPAMAARRLALLADFPLLAWSSEVDELAAALQSRIPLPPQAKTDAFHIAISAVHQMSYLVTWDSKHIANPRLRGRVEQVCLGRGYVAPRLCTPPDLMGR